jgi:hypothetical protein
MEPHYCTQDIDSITEEYLSGEMPQSAQQMLEQHFITCQGCWDRLQFTKDIRRHSRVCTNPIRRVKRSIVPTTRVVTARPRRRLDKRTMHEYAVSLQRLRTRHHAVAALDPAIPKNCNRGVAATAP